MFHSSLPLEGSKRSVTWEQRLDSAYGEREIVAVAREFLAMFDPFELHALPPECRPPMKIVDGDDISTYAFDLVRHGCDTEGEENGLTHKLARFFSHAATRLSKVNAFRAPGVAEPRQSA